MPLAAPTNLTLGNLMRGLGRPATVRDAIGQQIEANGPSRIFLMGLLRWNNTESAVHTVEVVVNGKKTYAPSGARSILVELGYRDSPDLSNIAVTASVRLVNTTESTSAATLTASLDITTAASDFNTSLAVEDNRLRLPEWSGWINGQALNYYVWSRTTMPPRSFGTLEYFADAQKIVSTQITVLHNATFSSFEGWQYGVGVFAGERRQSVLGGNTQSAYFALDLPPALQQGVIYRAAFYVMGGTLAVGSTRYVSRQAQAVVASIDTFYQSNSRIFPAVYGELKHYVFSKPDVTRTATLFFEAPAPVGEFEAEDVVAKVLRNAEVRFELKASYRATWSMSGTTALGIEYDPPVFGTAGPDRAYLTGTMPTAGTFVILLTATKVGSTLTTTSKATITVVDSLPRTTIATNSTISRDGVDARVGDSVSLSLASTPSPAEWRSEGLPPGVTIDANGLIGGIPTRAGVFFASVTAQAEEYDVSLPLTIRFVVGVGTTPLSSAASQRIPWLLTEWNLTDLQVLARSREVQSTFLEGEGGLRIKLGDDVSFVVFFVGPNDDVFAMSPETLRLTVRTENNLDEVLVFKSATPPVAVVREGMTYYEMSVRTGNRERELALEWVEEAEANEALPCVADLDWTKDGKVYSSRSFPMLLELDVTRP
jgi:hypothetical protein